MTGPRFRILLLVVATVGLSCCALVTETDETRGNMMNTFVNIDRYYRKTGKLPLSLRALTDREKEFSMPVDGWGKPLLYGVSNDGIITLTSYGPDGKPGGGIWWDADVSMSYY